MSEYESLLIAYGTSPEEARFLAWDQQRAWLANRENPKYGVYDPNPPSPEEVREAYEFKYGPSRAA